MFFILLLQINQKKNTIHNDKGKKQQRKRIINYFAVDHHATIK
jgi:hypothetical protein